MGVVEYDACGFGAFFRQMKLRHRARCNMREYRSGVGYTLGTSRTTSCCPVRGVCTDVYPEMIDRHGGVECV